MVKIPLLVLTLSCAAVAGGKDLYEHHCLRCHTENSQTPTSLIRDRFRGNPEGIVELSKRCPWGRSLSEMEIELIAEWLSSEE